MTYKDKCIRVCDLAYGTESFEEQELFKLLYDIVMSNALRKHLFCDSSYYSDFCNYMAGSLYIRLLDKTKPPIKSISNYINTTYRGFFDVFSKAEFRQVIDTTLMVDGAEVSFALQELLRSQNVSYDTSLEELSIDNYIKSIPRIINNVIDSSRLSDKVMKNRMHISVLVSLVKSKELIYKLKREEDKELLSLIITHTKSKLQKDIIDNLRPDSIISDELNILLFNDQGDNNE